MFQKTKLCRGLMLAFGGSALLLASQAHAQSQRVEITGSAIKRINKETPAPVEVITRADIARSGATSINELLRSISVIDINDQGELASNSPGGSGTSRIRLRGLGDTQTLVLINGRRVPKNPLADASGAGSAFNVNSIPVAAIERIEILKDGGSAIYGADAVAGVVNFILRKDYSGASAKLTLGQSSRSDGNEQAFSAVGGYGDPAVNRFNVMAAFDYLKRDAILRKDRNITSSVDFRRFGAVPGYNLDGRSSFSPQGNFLTPAGAFAGTTVTPCPPENLSGVLCVYDFNASLLTGYNGADRMAGLLNGTFQVTNDISVVARWIGSQNDDHFEAHPVPDFFVHTSGQQYAGRFMQGGPRITDKRTTFNHFDLGAEGAIGGLDFKVGLAQGTTKAVNRDKNYFNRTLWNAATQSGAIDATSLNNNQAAVDALKITPVRTAEEKLSTLDAQLSGDAFKLGSGTVRYAVGLSAWKEEIVDTPDLLAQQNLVVGSIQQSVVAADRDAHALFGELQIPLAKSVEMQLAVRHDDYKTAKATSPKVAVKWDVVPGFSVRSSYSESFKMPTLKQLFASAGQGAITLTPGQCQQVGNTAAECANGLPAFRRTGSNPTLQPEEGKSYNIGVITESGPFSLSVDFWRINKTNNISTLTLQSAINGGFFLRDAQNRVVVLQNLQNFSQTRNSGIDVDGRLQFKGLAMGDLTLRGTGTYYTSQATRTDAASPWAEFNNTYNSPIWRSTVSATLAKGPWTWQTLVRATGGFWDTDISRNNFTATTPGATRKVPTYEEIDLSVTWEGIKNFKFSGSVKNMFDRMPPFSARNATSNNYTQQGHAELYNARGRYFQVGVEYTY